MADVIDPGEPIKVHKILPHRHSKGEEKGHSPKSDDYRKRDELKKQHTEDDIRDHFDTRSETTEAKTVSETFGVSPLRSEFVPGKTKGKIQKRKAPPPVAIPEPGRFKPQGGRHGRPWTD